MNQQKLETNRIIFASLGMITSGSSIMLGSMLKYRAQTPVNIGEVFYLSVATLAVVLLIGVLLIIYRPISRNVIVKLKTLVNRSIVRTATLIFGTGITIALAWLGSSKFPFFGTRGFSFGVAVAYLALWVLICSDIIVKSVAWLNVSPAEDKQFLAAVTTLYLILPVIGFVYGWLRFPLSAITILLLVVFLIFVIRDIYIAVRTFRLTGGNVFGLESSNQSYLWIVSALAIILVWLMFSGVGGAGFQNSDYDASNALLKDLIAKSWPLTTLVDGASQKIVYYVGYYLPSAVVGKLFGWVAANVFSFLWTLIGVLLAFAWFIKTSAIRLEKKAVKLVGLALIFCFAGGLDIIGAFLYKGDAFTLTQHFEFWPEIFQYSSQTTLMYWVPQHTIAAWLLTGMLVNYLCEPRNLKYLGMAVAAGVLWTPFGVIGLSLFLLLIPVVYFSFNNSGYLFNRKSMLFNVMALLIGGINLLYLASNQYSFDHGFIWHLVEDKAYLFKTIAVFWVLEFILLAFVVMIYFWLAASADHVRDKKNTKFSLSEKMELLKQRLNISPIQFIVFLVSLLTLTLLPLYKMGVLNDLVMRASIPSLFVLWAFAGKAVMGTDIEFTPRLRIIKILIGMILIIGFFPSIVEISRSIQNYRFAAPEFETVSESSKANRREKVIQRVGTDEAFFFQYFGKQSVRVRPLTEKEQLILEEWQPEDDLRRYLRVQIISLSQAGWNNSAIAANLNILEDTVQNAIMIFNDGGFEAIDAYLREDERQTSD